MKRRLIAFLMCLVMLIGCFAGCKKDDKDKDKDKDDKTEQVTPEPSDEPEPTDDPEPTKAPENVYDYEKGVDVTTLKDGDEFDKFLNEVYLSLITTDSFSLHFKMQDPKEHGIDLDYTYGEVDSDDAMLDFIDTLKEGLDKFNYDELSESQQIAYDLLKYELDMYYKGEELEDNFYIWYLAQNNNVISNLQTMFTEYSIQTEQDAEDFALLLSMLPDYLDDVKEMIQEDVDDGIYLTDAMLDMSIQMAEDWLSEEADENIIYVSFEVNMIEAGLDDETEEKYLKEVEKTIDESMIPAIEEYIEYLESLEDYLVESKGLSGFEGGKEYYDWHLETYLGTGYDADDIYDYAEAKYGEMMERLLTIVDENPDAVMSLFVTPESKYSDDPQEILEALEELAMEHFPDVGELDWVVSYLDSRQEVESVVAYYLSPQLDNIGRRIIRINGSNISDDVQLFVTLAHEGAPGHLYQDQFTFKDEGYQEINSTLSYLGYQEGWAMYVEKLAYEWCLDDEEIAELMNINTMLNYIIIGLADIGINYKGWTYDEFADWMEEQGMANDDDTLTYIWDMVVSDPALYPAYGIGYLLMNDTVDALLDEGYTEKEAYEMILDIGSSPYSILWEKLGIEPVCDIAE